jgi:hypothetical protein
MPVMECALRQIFGLFLAALVLLAPLMLANAVAAASPSLADVTMLCAHRGNPGELPSHEMPRHGMPGCQLCPVCHGVSGPQGVFAATPALPRPRTIRMAHAKVLAPKVASPPRFVALALPRGPPSRV